MKFNSDYVGFGWAAIAILSICASAGPAAAREAACQVPLRNVLVAEQDCNYYQTAFKMMGTKKVSVNAVCKKGQFTGPNGLSYKSQVLTTLTVHGAACSKMKPVELNPVLLSKTNCANLKSVVAMLSTDFVGVDVNCNFGKWVGADGSPRGSMVATRIALRSRVATQ